MAVRKANARWEGDLQSGNGKFAVNSGSFEGAYSFSTRFEEEPGTNPEELIGAAHAACFSMAFSAAVAKAGYTPNRVETTANVHLDKTDSGFSISKIVLDMEADIEGIDEDAFQEHAEGAKKNCPVSRALSAVNIELNARLNG
jgi:lipoyl-dependent peroxiredoxin